MRVLGIDPGLARCGYGVVEAASPRPRTCGFGAVETSGPDVAPRLVELAARLRRVIAELRPDVAAVERVFFNANVRTAMTVGQAAGVALLVAAESGLAVSAWTPPQVKLAVTGTGGAPKEQVAYMVRALLGLPETPVPADAADALAVALCHLHHAGLSARDGAAEARPAASVAEDWLRRAAPTSPGLRARA